MGGQGWAEAVDALVVDGTQITTTSSEVRMCPDFNFPAYYMVPGRTVRVTAFGEVTNTATTSTTLRFRLRWGGYTGTALATTDTISLSTVSVTNASWNWQSWITCRTASTSGTFCTAGIVFVQYPALNIASVSANLMPLSGTAVTTVDTTTANLLSCTAQLSKPTSSNLTLQKRIIE